MPRGRPTASRIDQLLHDAMASMFAGATGAPRQAKGMKPAGRRKKGTMSPEGKARIAAAQRKRWAAWNEPKRGKISAAGLARIREANRRRWAKYRKEKARGRAVGDRQEEVEIDSQAFGGRARALQNFRRSSATRAFRR